MKDEDLRRLVAETVAETLLKLGIDASDPLELQRDMQHLRAWRESISQVRMTGILTAIGVVTSGVLGLIWLALKGN